jgi:Raf kinase inhibitor-like YbhB/YbcL family protein
MAFTLRSEAFVSNESLNSRFTCEGDDRSPPLDWVEAPAGTRSFALIVDDPDAPDPQAPERVFVHWVLYNIPASVNSLPENVQPEALPPGDRAGIERLEEGRL